MFEFNLSNILVIASCFISAVLLTNSLKYIFVHFNFKFPWFISAAHMLFSRYGGLLVLSLSTNYMSIWNKSTDSEEEEDSLIESELGDLETTTDTLPNIPTTYIETQNKTSTVLTGIDFIQQENLYSYGLVALLTVGVIAASNTSIVYIYPSFGEMISSTTPFFSWVVAILLFSHEFNLYSLLALIPVVLGGLLCVHGEVNFHLIGVLLQITSILLRALRVNLQSKMLKENPDPLILLINTSPYCFILFLFGCFISEGFEPFRALEQTMVQNTNTHYLFLGLIISSLIAAVFNLTTYRMIHIIGPVGASVIHNAKIPLILLVSSSVFGNKVSFQQVIGILMTMYGVWAYSKTTKPHQQTTIEVDRKSAKIIGKELDGV